MNSPELNPTMSTHTPEEIRELANNETDINEGTFGQALSEVMFEEEVAESKRKHNEFVCHYLGEKYEPKFNDARAGQPYLIMFFHTKKTRNFAIPPVVMEGKTEYLKSGRMYQCSGQEARMTERVLATKKIEILNLTPRNEGIEFGISQICQQWGPLNGIVQKRKSPSIFYTDEQETEVAESETEEKVHAASGNGSIEA